MSHCYTFSHFFGEKLQILAYWFKSMQTTDIGTWKDVCFPQAATAVGKFMGHIFFHFNIIQKILQSQTMWLFLHTVTFCMC